MQVFISLKILATALHSIPITCYCSIMRLVIKVFSHVENHAYSMATGIAFYLMVDHQLNAYEYDKPPARHARYNS
jgi:hypothetical protein